MAKVKLGNVKGPKGEQGVRGSKWYNTDKITGESTSGTAFPESGIADAMVGDMALNPTTLNLYTCQTAGNAATAKWVFMACIKGPQGEQGPKGDPTTVDAVLSKDSTNPIQNKAVATKFQDVQDSLPRFIFKKQSLILHPGETSTVFDFKDTPGVMQMAYVRQFSSVVKRDVFIAMDVWDNNQVAVKIESTRNDSITLDLGCTAIFTNA